MDREQRTPRESTQKPKQSGGGGRWVRAIIMVIATLGLCVFLAFFIVQSASDLFGLNQPDKQIEIVIPENSTPADVAGVLAANGVVQNQLTFQIYSGVNPSEQDFQPGKYILNSNMGYDQIILALKSGKTQKQEITLTFIEGRTLREIANQLEENKVCSAKEFMEYLDTADFNQEFTNQIPSDSLRFSKMEGYIFPDTYDFYIGMDVPQVAAKFLDNFEKRITPEMKTKMQNSNTTLDQAIILASVIQKEAGDLEEMKLVSSVFHNRMAMEDTYPNLQSDVTIVYVERNIKPYLKSQNQPMYDAYNTYIKKGLPIGPICNPGMDAIMAAIDPPESPYYFFVTDVQEVFYYATTAKQHYNNVAIASKVEGEGEIHGTATRGE